MILSERKLVDGVQDSTSMSNGFSVKIDTIFCPDCLIGNVDFVPTFMFFFSPSKCISLRLADGK